MNTYEFLFESLP
ncbi:Protein CBG27745 [Caenorhabditis briggsae]|uniref:Protein CBG27745 n=1 Tax=Caenorhabditis briggsae TaxID=6238 RepID=B6IJ43_CAEBR|nr:Protein CBG27745 [Caenorhabditis briggsae]CAS00023.1 Protein CBG27745 [Caenorhabditis briggsae]